jgi:hypothetical protein
LSAVGWRCGARGEAEGNCDKILFHSW